MDVQAITRYVRMSPSKAQDLARAIQGRPVSEALALTQLSRRKAAVWIGKTLRSAIANAEKNAKLSADKLFVKQAWIEDGPRLKRWWPRARGMASPILRRMSHIRIVLSDEPPPRQRRRAKRS